jgi:hypothetical protein
VKGTEPVLVFLVLTLTIGLGFSPGFPVELGGFGELHAPFFTEKRTRGSLQCIVAGNPGSGNG